MNEEHLNKLVVKHIAEATEIRKQNAEKFANIEKKLDDILSIIGGVRWGWKVTVAVVGGLVLIANAWDAVTQILKHISGR